MKLNEIQEKAVNLIDENITLIAGAGTGKTRVLTSRYINIVKNNINPKNILAITFTNKAAEEMKSRISKEMVNDNLSFDESDLNIMTIHAFCLEMVKDYSLILGINPNFDVCDEAISNALIKRSIEEVLNNNSDLDYEKYLLDFKTAPFEEEHVIANLYSDFRNNNFDLDEILNKTLNFESSDYIDEDLFLILEDYSNALKPSAKFYKFYNGDDFQKIKDKKYLDEESLNLILNNLGNSKPNQKKIDKINEIILGLKKNLEEKNRDYYIFITNLLKKINSKYILKKELLNILDYDDLISYTSKIIENTYLKKEIQNRYKYILIDEYQDTNTIQNKIIKNFNNSNLFIVGDPKQSIYGFRGSDLKSYFTFSRYIESVGKSLVMNINYRSDKNIINFINDTFIDLLNPYEELISHIDYNGKVSIYKSNEDEEIIPLINDLLKKYDAKDIALLFRSNNKIDEVSQILSSENINYNKGKRKILDIEVLKVLNNILSTIYRNEEFIKTLSLFNSPILKFDFESLVEILNKNIRSLDDIKNIENKEIKLKNFLEALDNLKTKSQILYIDEVTMEIIKYLNSLNTLTSDEREYLFEFQEIVTEFVEIYSNDFRLFEEYIELKEFDDLEDGINLLTIHRSKGLEFKAVVICDMDSSRVKSNKNKIVVNANGLGIKSNFSNYNYLKILENNKKIDLEEEKRILYVAMTRAKEELILFGNYDKAVANSYFKLIENQTRDLDEYHFSDIEKEKTRYKVYETLGNYEITENRIREYYTVTDFINFKRNKLDFYKKYFMGIDEYTMGSGQNQIIDPKLLGNIVHFFAENYSKKDIKKGDIDIYINKIFNFYEEELTNEKYEIVLELCKNYIYMEEENIIDKELVFYYDLDGYLIKGFIDQVVLINGDHYIIDLKTSTLPLEEIYNLYKDQLILYAKFYRDLYKVDIKGAYIFDLRGKNKIYVETTSDIEMMTLKEFESFIKFIRSHKRYIDYI